MLYRVFRHHEHHGDECHNCGQTIRRNGPSGALVLGLMLAYVALTSRKLWPCILLHSLSNIYGAFIPTLWPKDDLPSLALYALIYIMIMPLTAVILTVLSRKEIMKVCA